jgi:hypothetical protein
MKKHLLFGLSIMTALTGMNVPAAETSPDDSAVSAEGISFPQDTLPPMDLTAASENISMPPDSPDVKTLAMNIPVCADPLKAARQIRAQVEAAAQSILHEQQVESVHSTLNHTQFLLTGESEYLLEDEPETEFVEETESELIEETEAITEVWPVEVDSALLADDGGSAEQPAPETENPSEGEASPEDGEGSTLPGPGHGMFTVPEMRGTNIARLNLYDYRLLRSYPLPVLAKDMHRLYDQTKQLVSGFEGEWSVYVQNLSNGQAMVMNDKPLNSASVMKLFIMETVYEAFAAGTVPRNEDTVYLLRNMIINSSNESSNRLLEILGNGDLAAGVGKVNDFILSHGYTPETVIYNGLGSRSDTRRKPPEHGESKRRRTSAGRHIRPPVHIQESLQRDRTDDARTGNPVQNPARSPRRRRSRQQIRRNQRHRQRRRSNLRPLRRLHPGSTVTRLDRRKHSQRKRRQSFTAHLQLFRKLNKCLSLVQE